MAAPEQKLKRRVDKAIERYGEEIGFADVELILQRRAQDCREFPNLWVMLLPSTSPTLRAMLVKARSIPTSESRTIHTYLGTAFYRRI